MNRLLVIAVVFLAACGGGSEPTSPPTPPPVPPPPPPAPAQFALQVSGSGSGAIASTPAGINCTLTAGASSGACSANFTSDQVVSLAATAASDWEFGGWTGGTCGVAGACQVAMSANTSVAAAFALAGGPGQMKLDLGTAAAGTGGLIVSITGGSITSVTAAAGYQIRTSALGQSPLRLLIRGPVAAGKLADLQVADRKAAFTVTVQAASAGQAGNYAVLAPAGYQGTVGRP